MVPLVDGSWREVRTLAIGTVAPGRRPGTVRCADLSYFSPLADAATFTTWPRGRSIAAGWRRRGGWLGVVDGAEWCQHFLDAHRPDAVRILDFPHAAQRLSDVAEAVWGRERGGAGLGGRAAGGVARRHRQRVLAAIRALPLAAARTRAAAQVQAEVLGYLEPRLEQTALRRLPGAGLADRQRRRGERQQAGGRGPPQGRGPALGRGARQSDGGAAGALCSARWDEAWAAIARGAAGRTPPAPSRPRGASVAAPVGLSGLGRAASTSAPSAIEPKLALLDLSRPFIEGNECYTPAVSRDVRQA